MKQRQKYNSGIGIIHKLRINEVSKKGFLLCRNPL